MNHRKIYLLSKSLALLSPILSLAFLSGCSNEEVYRSGQDYSTVETSLNFSATVIDEGNFDYETRALTQTPFNVEAYAFPGNFYIEIWDPELPDYDPDDPTSVPPTPAPGEDGPKENPQFNTYYVPTGGNGGMLQYKGEINDTPNWCNIDDDHYFWSWTVPWEDPEPEETPDPEYPDDNGGESEGDNSDDTDKTRGLEEEGAPGEEYVPSYAPITITLQDTFMREFNNETQEWEEGSWKNGKAMETFVGAKSGPYNFRSNGPEVPLQFRHLMSKISLRKLTFYGSDGKETDRFQADIMFINMPTEFTFYPHPNRTAIDGSILSETEVAGVEENGAPIVVTNQNSADPNGGITFAFTNPMPEPEDKIPFEQQSELRDQFYICPDINFANVQFKVTLYDVENKYVNRGEYWGDFSNIVFERAPGTDYDNPEDPENPDSYIDDSRILHAGEVMYFDMIVRQSGGGGGSIYVSAWSERTRPASHYPHPGIYEAGQAKDVAGTAMSMAEKFELYGDGFFDGKEQPTTPSYQDGHLGVFHQYGDIDMGDEQSFPLDKNYVVDGMGYILKFSPKSTSATEVTIGKMVDIYIEINDEMIYIDPQGFIMKYNPSTGTYTSTGDQIILTDNKDSYKIDVKTGKFV